SQMEKHELAGRLPRSQRLFVDGRFAAPQRATRVESRVLFVRPTTRAASAWLVGMRPRADSQVGSCVPVVQVVSRFEPGAGEVRYFVSAVTGDREALPRCLEHRGFDLVFDRGEPAATLQIEE